MNITSLFSSHKKLSATDYKVFWGMFLRVQHLPTFNNMITSLFNSGYSPEEICTFCAVVHEGLKINKAYSAIDFIKNYKPPRK